MSPSFEARRVAAMRLLASKRLVPWHRTPLLFRLIWACGIEARPPHFAPFVNNVLSFGAIFALVFGIPIALMIVLGPLSRDWSDQPVLLSLGVIAATGLIGGFSSARDFQRKAREHRLPGWSDLAVEPETFD